MSHLHALWRDESGVVITSELLTIVAILVIGSMVGFVAIRDALILECGDIAAAIAGLNQSYTFNGAANTGSAAITSGGSFTNTRGPPDP